MTKRIFLGDHFVIDQPASEQALRDASSILEETDQPLLKVRIDATHSGLLTNRRVYPGRRVARSFKSFYSTERGGTAEFDKPVQLHHNDFQDPVGRVVGAKFTRLKSGTDFNQDFVDPDTDGKGSGVVTVDAEIVDPEAIQKILDGRYLSVSSGHSTDKMLCSVCGEDLFDYKKCEHMPGKSYDKQLCFAITGNLTYHEISFVNIPAQSAAKVIQKEMTTDMEHEKVQLRDSGADHMDPILTFVRAKKQIVSSLTLCGRDDDEEYNLLIANTTPKDHQDPPSMSRVVVERVLKEFEDDGDIETPADCEQDQSRPEPELPSDSGEESDAQDELQDDRPEADSTEPSNPDSDSLEATTHVGDQEMDDDKKIEFTQEEVKSIVDALRSENENLKRDSEELQAKVTNLEATVDAKDSEVQRLTQDLAEQQAHSAKVLATALAHTRISLRKPDTVDVDSAEKLAEYIDKLAERSIDSLTDSLTDLALEQESPIEDESRDEEDVADIAAADQVTSPTPEKVVERPKETARKTAIAALGDELDI